MRNLVKVCLCVLFLGGLSETANALTCPISFENHPSYNIAYRFEKNGNHQEGGFQGVMTVKPGDPAIQISAKSNGLVSQPEPINSSNENNLIVNVLGVSGSDNATDEIKYELVSSVQSKTDTVRIAGTAEVEYNTPIVIDVPNQGSGDIKRFVMVVQPCQGE